VELIFFIDFPIYLQSVYIYSNTISKLCVEKRELEEECSVTPLRDKKVTTLCGCRECGIDGIPNECLRQIPGRKQVHLSNLFKHCIRLSQFPKPWKEAKNDSLAKNR
jgi:hypothetical protein